MSHKGLCWWIAPCKQQHPAVASLAIDPSADAVQQAEEQQAYACLCLCSVSGSDRWCCLRAVVQHLDPESPDTEAMTHTRPAVHAGAFKAALAALTAATKERFQAALRGGSRVPNSAPGAAGPSAADSKLKQPAVQPSIQLRTFATVQRTL